MHNHLPRAPAAQKFVGRVFGTKMDKTITVRVDYIYRSKKYKMNVRRSSKIMAHDEQEEARVGDFVEIQACRKRSQRKAHQITRIIRRAPVLYPETKAVLEARKAEGQTMATSLSANVGTSRAFSTFLRPSTSTSSSPFRTSIGALSFFGPMVVRGLPKTGL